MHCRAYLGGKMSLLHRNRVLFAVVLPLSALALLGAVAVTKPYTLCVSYTDGDFVDSPSGPWTYTKVKNPSGDSCITVTDGRSASGGDPGAFRIDDVEFCTGKTL